MAERMNGNHEIQVLFLALPPEIKKRQDCRFIFVVFLYFLIHLNQKVLTGKRNNSTNY